MTRTLASWAPAALWAAALFFLSSRPSLPGPSFPFADKVGHLGFYGILGALLAWGAWRSGVGGRRRWILLGTLYGATDEWHQSFVPGRTAALDDLVADAVGVTLGFLIGTWILERAGRRLRRKEA